MSRRHFIEPRSSAPHDARAFEDEFESRAKRDRLPQAAQGGEKRINEDEDETA